MFPAHSGMAFGVARRRAVNSITTPLVVPGGPAVAPPSSPATIESTQASTISEEGTPIIIEGPQHHVVIVNPRDRDPYRYAIDFWEHALREEGLRRQHVVLGSMTPIAQEDQAAGETEDCMTLYKGIGVWRTARYLLPWGDEDLGTNMHLEPSMTTTPRTMVDGHDSFQCINLVNGREYWSSPQLNLNSAKKRNSTAPDWVMGKDCMTLYKVIDAWRTARLPSVGEKLKRMEQDLAFGDETMQDVAPDTQAAADAVPAPVPEGDVGSHEMAVVQPNKPPDDVEKGLPNGGTARLE